MNDRSEKKYCTLDHANKRRELARQTPYQFWVGQVARHGAQAQSGSDGRGRGGCKSAGGH